MFTIEVKKKGKDEEFSFGYLEMFHQECLGGKMGFSFQSAHIDTLSPLRKFCILTCNRCKQEVWVAEQSEAPNEIIKTAIDGQKREIEGYQGIPVEERVYVGGSTLFGLVLRGISDPKNPKISITVIPKT